MKTFELNIPTPDGICDAFVAHPSEGGTFAPVIFAMDAFGVRPNLKEMAIHFASLGYYVLLPNLFYRVRKSPICDATFPLKKEEISEIFQKQIMPLMSAYGPAQTKVDAGVFLDFLAQQKMIRSGPVGITGYCMGGNFGMRVAAWYPERVAAVASFHAGQVATEAPESPHRLAKSMRAEIYLAHADQDSSLAPDQISKIEASFKEAGLRFESELYTGARHGFTMKDVPAYDEAALRKHWEKVTSLFKRTLS